MEQIQSQCNKMSDCPGDDHGGDINIICRRYPKIHVAVLFLILLFRVEASLIYTFGCRIDNKRCRTNELDYLR
jgi:hypothetical protein